jgi:hypothetical protein
MKKKSETAAERCSAVLEDEKGKTFCELNRYHHGKHRGGGSGDIPGGITWSNEGAAQILKEMEQKLKSGESAEKILKQLQEKNSQNG